MAEGSWQSVAATLAENGLPALGGLIGSMVMPGIGTAIGNGAGKLAATAIAGALGVPPEPAAVQAAIQADPSAAQVKLAQIEADAKSHSDELADIQNARTMAVSLVQADSPIAWAPAILSGFVVVGFLALTILMIFKQVPDSQAALILFGNLAAGFGAVLQYWIGSSESSRRNGDAVRQLAQTGMNPSPAQIATKAIDAVRAKR